MHAALRICIGVILIAVAVSLALLSCQWGTNIAAPAVLLMPGVSPSTGLYAAEWAGKNPFVAMFVGIGVPVVLLTTAMWFFVRVRQ